MVGGLYKPLNVQQNHDTTCRCGKTDLKTAKISELLVHTKLLGRVDEVIELRSDVVCWPLAEVTMHLAKAFWGVITCAE